MDIDKYNEAEKWRKAIDWCKNLKRHATDRNFMGIDVSPLLDTDPGIRYRFVEWLHSEWENAEREFEKI
jgi:hypothetical protein